MPLVLKDVFVYIDLFKLLFESLSYILSIYLEFFDIRIRQIEGYVLSSLSRML